MKRSLLIISATALVALPAASLGSVKAAHQRAGGTVTVWEDFPTALLPEMQALAKKWAATNGNTVNFVNTSEPGRGGKSVQDLLPLKAKTSSGPDLVYITEDSQGGLVASGLLAKRPDSLLSAADMAKYQPSALGATSVNGVAYSVPHVVDGLVLYYNKKFVHNPPTTWAQLLTTAKKLTQGNRYGFLYNITGGFYWNYWAFGGYGAYVFGSKGGKPDTTDIGLSTPAAIQALTFIKSLTSIVPKSTDYNAPDANFAANKAAMIINGPWALDAYTKALGVNLGVAPIPMLPNGKASRTFIGVRVWAVNQFSKNQTTAWDLARYLSQNGQVISGKYEGRLPSYKTVPGFTPSPQQVAAAKAFSVGIPIPNIPEMAQVWTPAGNAITLVVQGRATAQSAATTATQQIKANIAKLNAGN